MRLPSLLPRLTRVCLTLVLSLTALGASAQFPTRAVTIVVPFTTGGSNDIFARAIGAELSRMWGQPVIVENRPGGGGSIGAGQVARAAPDGHTVMLMSSAFTINAALQPNLPFDPIRNFTSVALVGKGPMLLAASLGSGVKTPADLVAIARANPGKLRFASAGAGSANHMAMELLDSVGNFKMLHVPYKGGSQAITDIIGGHVDLYMGSVPQIRPHGLTGKAVAVGVSSRERSPIVPTVPSLADALPEYNFELWWGIFAPANLPRAVLAQLNGDINKVLTSPKLGEFLANEAAAPSPMSPEQFSDFVSREFQRWQKIVKDGNIKPE